MGFYEEIDISCNKIRSFHVYHQTNFDNVYSMSRQDVGKGALFVVSGGGIDRYDYEGWKRVFDSAAASILINKNSIYIGTRFAGVFHSVNEGNTWQAINQGLDITTPTSALSLDNLGYLYAGRSDSYWTPYGINEYYCSGMYRTKLSTITAVEKNQTSDFSMLEILPNPVSDVAHIMFTLNMPSYVSLTLHDMLGRELRMIINETMQTGIQEREIPMQNLPQGMYFLRCTIGETIQIRRIMVMN